MTIKMFNEFISEGVSNIINFKMLDVSPIQKRFSDLSSFNITYDIIPTIYNFYDGKLISSMSINPKISLVDNLRQIRKNSVGELSPGFRVNIKVPLNTKDDNWLLSKLASVEKELSPSFRYDSKQDSEGYHVDFIYKTKEIL